MSARLADYRFELPDELIARRPLAERTASRLLVLGKDDDAPSHRRFTDVVDLLHPGDVLVVNDTSVVPARLIGEKAETGGRVEVLLVRPVHAGRPRGAWLVLLGASKKPKPGGRVVFGSQSEAFEDLFFGVVEGTAEEAGVHEPGCFVMRFEGDVLAFAAAAGHVPLPPYLQRDDDDLDRARYQTVFSDPDHAGSSAAPTAGLHFDDALLEAIRARGVTVAKVTLHVGPGTFLPVRKDDLDQHVMHAEPWVLPEATAFAVNAARARGGRVVAVGTTSVRVLETAAALAAPGAPLAPGSGLTRLFIRPGRGFRAVDAMITNFHLPESTLLVLVAAAVGRERALAAYAEAVRAGYRFYSYGDACWFDVVPSSKSPAKERG